MKMQLPIHVPEDITVVESGSATVSETVMDTQITVSKNDSCVPDSHNEIYHTKSRRAIGFTTDSMLPLFQNPLYIISLISLQRYIKSIYSKYYLPLRERCLPLRTVHKSRGRVCPKEACHAAHTALKGGE